MNNCTRENKNRYFLRYIECALAWNTFDEVQVSFLPIGHTHEDIDQSFFCTARRIRSNNAATLIEFCDQLKLTFNELTKLTAMTNIENSSGLLETMSCFNVSLPTSSHYRYFKFLKSSCNMRDHMDGKWMTLHLRKKSILAKILHLLSTPETAILFPTGKQEVIERFHFQNSSINSSTKTRELLVLTERVIQLRILRFHWSQSSVKRIASSSPE